MKVLLAKSAGFCWGVRRAVDRARSLVADSGGAVHTDGPLIHNQQMMDQLTREGIRESATPHSLGEGTLIIRAHGIPPERRALLKSLPVHLVDATCPDVAKIQSQIRRHAARGFHVLIYGDHGHAEVTGLLGYADGRGHVVACAPDVAALPEMSPVCLVSQSTQFPASYAKIVEAVRARFPGAEVLNTICRSTQNRQKELIELAGRADAVVVVGGANSANTLRLVELARSLKPTLHIQTEDQINPADLEGVSCVALTAGASTPAFIIERVQRALEAM